MIKLNIRKLDPFYEIHMLTPLGYWQGLYIEPGGKTKIESLAKAQQLLQIAKKSHNRELRVVKYQPEVIGEHELG